MIYLAPSTVEEAVAHLAEGRVLPLAGGTDVFPAKGEGPQRVTVLDLTRIAALRGISRTGSGWRIGATTTWSDIVKAGLPPAFDALRAVGREVGSIQIQNAGTIAGNICNASPAADSIPPLLALDAEVELGSARGTRRMPLAAFITGVRSTALREDEILLAVHIPEPAEDWTSAFLKLGSRKYLVISIAVTATMVRLSAGRIAEARCAVGACSPVARRLPALESALVGLALEEVRNLDIDAAHLAPLSPIDDVRGSSDYRLEAVAELVRRALLQAMGEADG